MPYDLQTIFGTRHGQLTPAEAHAAVLRQVIGGPDNSAAIADAKNAGDLSQDPFFRDSHAADASAAQAAGTPVTAAGPASAPVMGGAHPMAKDSGYGTDEYFRNRDIGRADQQDAIVKTLRGQLQEDDLRGLSGGNAGSGFTESVPYQTDIQGPPSPQPRTSYAADRMTGGSAPAPAAEGGAAPAPMPSPGGGHVTQDEIEHLMMRQAMINGTQVPDIMGLRTKAAKDALELAAANRAEADAVKTHNAADATTAHADDPIAQRAALKAAGAPQEAVAPEKALASDRMSVDLAKRLADKMRNALTSLTPEADAAILQPEINVLVKRLVAAGANEKLAREFVMSGLGDVQGGFTTRIFRGDEQPYLDPANMGAGGNPFTTPRNRDPASLARGALGLPER